MSRDDEALPGLIARRLEGGWDSADARDAGNYLAPTIARLIAAARVEALREAADNLPVSSPGQSQEWSARWLRRRADAFEAAATDDTPGGDK